MRETAAGADLRIHFSKTTKEIYLANTCGCGAFIGEFYVHDYWDLADNARPVYERAICSVCTPEDFTWSSET
jgi:hypothetical protein